MKKSLRKQRTLSVSLGFAVIVIVAGFGYFRYIYNSTFKQDYAYLHTFQYPSNLDVQYIEGPQDCGFESCYYNGSEVLLYSSKPAKDFVGEVSAFLTDKGYKLVDPSCSSDPTDICMDFTYPQSKNPQPPCAGIRLDTDEFNKNELHLQC